MISVFVAFYGYLAIFVGTLLEGETTLIAAGIAAHRGRIEWPLVILAAMVSGTLATSWRSCPGAEKAMR